MFELNPGERSAGFRFQPRIAQRRSGYSGGFLRCTYLGVTFGFSGGRIADIYAVSNPDKLRHLKQAASAS